MGHPDLTERTIREQLPRMRSYCVAICAPERVEEALSAAVLEFRARSTTARPSEDLDSMVAKAARSGASARANLSAGHSSSPRPECLAMPELLAARANDELPGDDRVVRQHLSECIICETTFAQMRRAEQLLATPWPPAVEVELPEPRDEAEPAAIEPRERFEQPETASEPPEPVDQPEPAAEPGVKAPAEQPQPELGAAHPEPLVAPPSARLPPVPPAVVKRRSGGLVERVRKVARNALR